MSAGQALQKAVFATLVGDAELEGLIGGAKVFDHVPRNAAAPNVHLGEAAARDWSTASDTGAEVSFSIDVWSRAEGRSEGLVIAERVRALLHDAALALDGYRLVNLRHVDTRTSREDEPAGRRVAMQFRAVVEVGE